VISPTGESKTIKIVQIRDLAADAGQAERLERMKKRLGEWQREHHDPVPPLRLALRRP
jgi:hypothetical protein